MMALGYVPTSTTYTALISAYGKAGQLDSALNTFDQMVQPSVFGCKEFIVTSMYILPKHVWSLLRQPPVTWHGR